MKTIPEAGFYPFWFWNGVEEENEIIRQLDEIAGSGCKGFALHSRKGNQIPYLSGRWLDLVEFTCIEAEKRRLKLWLYDEDGFPSGNAGMQVQKVRPDLVQKSLRFSLTESKIDADAYASFSPDGKQPVNEAELPGGTPVLRFTIYRNAEHVDTLSPETVNCFLNLNHEVYARRIGRFFGNTVEAVYTDDESFLVWYENSFVWSETLEKVLGPELKKRLPELVFDLPGSAEFRKNYFRTAQKLFIENFIIPQREWCHAHNLVYLGHLCGDEGPRVRAVKNFASPEPYYLAEDVPSIDDYLLDMKDLGYLKRPYAGDAFRHNACGLENCYPLYTFLSAASAANRMGVNQVSSEIWAFLGWNMPPEFLEAQTLFEIGMGQTLLTIHAFYYTLDGEAEQDCPPSYFIQQPYWPLLKRKLPVWNHLAEQIAAAGRIPETALVVPDLFLTLQNGETLAGKPGKLAEADRKLQELILEMMRHHLDFDLIEENQLQQCRREGGTLIAGKMRYQKIIVHSDLPLSSGSIKKLDGMTLQNEKSILCVSPEWSLPEEIMVIHRRTPEGKRFDFLQNLSGKKQKLAGAFPEKGLTLIEPLSGRAVFTGDAFPEGFTLPHGKTLLAVQVWSGPEIKFHDSIYNLDTQRDSIDFTGFPEGARKAGDLTCQGFSGKTGIFEYRTRFFGPARLLELAMTGGVAEVLLNGNSIGIWWGSDVQSIAGRCLPDGNELLIRFANTAGNRYGNPDSPFGVDSIAIYR